MARDAGPPAVRRKSGGDTDLDIRRHDRLGGIIHEYRHAA
jgi:hypothetical protein